MEIIKRIAWKRRVMTLETNVVDGSWHVGFMTIPHVRKNYNRANFPECDWCRKPITQEDEVYRVVSDMSIYFNYHEDCYQLAIKETGEQHDQ
jgi:hypothetical protein